MTAVPTVWTWTAPALVAIVLLLAGCTIGAREGVCIGRDGPGNAHIQRPGDAIPATGRARSAPALLPALDERGAVRATIARRVALGCSPAPMTDYHRRRMTADQSATSAIGFGSGISDDHRDGIRWVDYANISWNPVFCKRCDICVEICPKNTLVLRNDAIIEDENCILCGLCERYCPDLAIEMIPEAVAAHQAEER